MTRALMYRGAEADLLLDTWQGFEAVFKVRKPLPYRHPALDDSIRRQRTLHEAEMLHAAKDAGVSAPRLYFTDSAESTLVMEYVRGRRLKEAASSHSRTGVARLFETLGDHVAKLHAFGIMHGDLTTANIMLRGSGLVFLDFGLSIRTSRVEDHAVDLRLIKETLVGAHPTISSNAIENLMKGYASRVGQKRHREVAGQLRNIERRGRYARPD